MNYIVRIAEYAAVVAPELNVSSKLSITVGNETATNTGNENEPYLYLVLKERVNAFTPYIVKFDGQEISGIVGTPIAQDWDWTDKTSFGSSEVFLTLSENALNNAPVSMESVEGPLKLRVAGKNLVQPAWNLESQTQTGVTCTRTGNSFTLAGTNSGSGGINFYIQRYDTASAFSLPAGTYTLSGMPARAENKSFLLGLYHRLPGGTNEQLATDYGNPSRSKQTFTLGEATDSLFLVIGVGVGVNADGVTVTPQIEVGSEFTDYEEPSNTTVEIPLIGKDGQSLEPLRMSYIGYVATKAQNPDCIVLKNGVWYVKRTTAQLDLTNATWVKGSSYFAIRMDGKLIPGAQSKFVLCTHFPGSGEASNSGGIWCGTGLALQNDAVPDYATNEWMAEFCAEQAQAGTPVTVVYSLSEPIYEELHQDVQNILNTLTVPIDVCSVWFEGEVAPTADIGIPRGDFPSENARALAMTRADRTLSNLTDYQKALHNIGAMPGKNFADNSRFAKVFIVNQASQSSYSGGFSDPCIDRWHLWGSVTLEDDGIVVQSQEDVVEFLYQNIPDEYLSYLRGKQVTMSVVYQESGTRKISSVTFVVAAQGDIDSPEIDINGILFDLYKISNMPYARYRFFYLGGSSVQIKLEAIEVVLGDHQTIVYTDDNGSLQFISPGNYMEELIKCQHYAYVPSQSITGPQFRYYGGSENRLVGILPFPVQMRTQPVLSGFPITFRDTDNGQNVVIDSAQYFICDTGLTLWWQLNTTSGTFVDGHLYTVTSAIKFSAEL